jgi:hypothetical protein
MSTNLPSNRYPYQHPDPHTDNGFRLLFNANTDVQQAITALNAKVVSLTSQVTTATTVVTTTKASTPSTGGSFPVNVNEQTADYVIQQTDVAGLNYFTGTGPYALELNVGVVKPFYTSVLNLSSGIITATPTSGLGEVGKQSGLGRHSADTVGVLLLGRHQLVGFRTSGLSADQDGHDSPVPRLVQCGYGAVRSGTTDLRRHRLRIRYDCE